MRNGGWGDGDREPGAGALRPLAAPERRSTGSLRLSLAALALLAVLSGCGKGDHPPAVEAAQAAAKPADGSVVIPLDSPTLAEVKVEAAETAQAPVDEVVSPGKIETNPNLVGHVMLPVAGRITAVMAKIGDAVKRGDPLLTIESPDADSAESSYRQAQAGLMQAKSNLLKAQADYDRLSDLFSHNAVAKKDVLSAENALAQSKAAVEQADAAIEQGGRRLAILGLKPGAFGQRVTTTAPVSGKVLEMSVAAGEYRNDTNAPVMTIADLSTVWVSSDVPESQIRLIQVGERIDVNLTAFPGETFRGRVTRIADTVDPQTRTIKVRAEMDNSHGRLRPEMFGTIRHTDALRTTPVVPAAAVVQEGGRSIVWLERSRGRFQPVDVQTGSRIGEKVAILSGLKAGDRVVVDGAMLLRTQ